jgi:hypothetical protein
MLDFSRDLSTTSCTDNIRHMSTQR